MPDKTVWVIREPQVQPRAAANVSSPKPEKKNPALAFSLSLLFWGGGQMYNRQRGLGFLFLLMMASFYGFLPLTVLYWKSISSSLSLVFINSSQIFAAWGALYFAGLILWAFNAIQAYFKSMQTRTDPFQGIDSRLLPPLCSSLIPGWGQFLNGQPKKGGFLLLFALAGHYVLSTALLTVFLWPVLDTDIDRFLLERALAVAIVLSPLIFLMWVFGIYDALRVCLDPVKKEPLRKRIEYAINRMRVRGWKNGIVSWTKLNLALSLFLGLSLILSYNYFPQRDYVTMLKNLEGRLSNQKMVFVPRLIEQFIQAALPQEPRR